MVRKSNNQEEEFNPDKIRRSIQNAGADQQLADEITRQIQGSTHSGMTTSEIDSSVQEILKQRDMNAYNNWMQWKKQHQSSR
jgi:transcriptional regulator NrdR family protein